MIELHAFDTETINRDFHGEACLLIRKIRGKSPEFLEFPRNFDQIFDFLAVNRGKMANYGCWNMDFDARAILHPDFLNFNSLAELAEKGRVKWGKYQIKYVPGKFCRIYRNKGGKKGFILYDIHQFFGLSLKNACIKYLPVEESKKEIPRAWYLKIDKILRKKGKNRDKLLNYANYDVISLEKLSNIYLNSLKSANIDVPKLISTGYISANFFGPKMRKSFKRVGWRCPDGVNRVFQRGFRAGRIEVFKIGKIAGPLWLYDLHSAYPAEIAKLCPFEPRLYENKPYGDSYSMHYIKVDVPYAWDIGPIARPYKEGVAFPTGEFDAYVGGPGLDFLRELGLKYEVFESWYVPIINFPLWPETQTLYDKRRDPISGLAMKTVMASWYGKLCETKARFFRGEWQEYAGYTCFPWACAITENTRLKVTRALYELKRLGHEPIFAATDGILCKMTHDVGLSTSNKMGDWGCERFDSAVVLGCGRYYLFRDGEMVKSHLRGFPQGYDWKKLRDCHASQKKVFMKEAFSLKEWANACGYPDFNVLKNVGRYLAIEDDKRHWPKLPKTLANAFTECYDSRSLILGGFKWERKSQAFRRRPRNRKLACSRRT